MGARGRRGGRPGARRGTPATRAEKALAGGTVGFALLFALRDSNALKIANGLAVAFCLGALLLPKMAGGLRSASLSRLLYAPFTALATLAGGFYRIAVGAADERKATPEAGRRRRDGGARRSCAA